MFMVVVLVFFLLVGKGILVFEMVSGMHELEPSYTDVGNRAYSYLWDSS